MALKTWRLLAADAGMDWKPDSKFDGGGDALARIRQV